MAEFQRGVSGPARLNLESALVFRTAYSLTMIPDIFDIVEKNGKNTAFIGGSLNNHPLSI